MKEIINDERNEDNDLHKKKIKGIVEVKIRVTNLQLKCVTLMKLVTSFNEQKNK
jgi:hypothetical protein